MAPSISRLALFEIWVRTRKNNKIDTMMSYVVKEIGNIEESSENLKSIKYKIRRLNQSFEKKWAEIGRHRQRFLDTYSTWISKSCDFTELTHQIIPKTTQQDSTTIGPGRPAKSFSACGSKAQKYKVQHLLESSSQELSIATGLKLHKEGKRDSASIVKELLVASPNRGTILKKTRKLSPKQPLSMSEEQALALIVDANLSTRQYQRIREQAKSLRCLIYPSYNKVKEAKVLCYPPGIIITETSAEIPLQTLIDHTLFRFCQIEEISDKLHLCEENAYGFIVKWGCDGSEQNQYKQRFTQQNSTDESLFSLSMVPMEFFCGKEDSKSIIWKNPAASSTRYCRPIKLVFSKESTDLINKEVDIIKQQIENLTPTKISLGDLNITITATMLLCMIDGKVCNALSSCSSAQCCYLCGAKPSEMNDVKLLSKKEVNKEYLTFGLSPLHAWIRIFECILHISYRLEFKTWQARGNEKKEKVTQKKKEVQEKFRSELGLLVDIPKQQSGNTNDGNSARKFFRNAVKSAEITGVNIDLIKRLGVILECINSGHKINLEKFESYINETREIYIKLYGWYPMPVTLHKILFHGVAIIESCILPIGQYSEEAQEARNKHNKQFRENYTRKTSRIDTNTDLLNRLLITSDPFIASLRASPKTKHSKMNPDMLNLIASENILESDNSDTSDDSLDDDNASSETD